MEESNDEIENDSDESGEPESSSDDEHQWKKAVKEEYKKVQHEKKLKERRERMQNKNNSNNQIKEPKFYEIKDGASVYSNGNKNKATDAIIKNEKLKKLPLLNRLQQSKSFGNNSEISQVFRSESYGNKQMTFSTKKVRFNF